MGNTFILDYSLRKLNISFNEERFDFNIPVEEKSFYWDNFRTKDGEFWTVEFNQLDENDSAKVNIYKNNEGYRDLDILKNTNPLSYKLHLEKAIGDAELYFYLN